MCSLALGSKPIGTVVIVTPLEVFNRLKSLNKTLDPDDMRLIQEIGTKINDIEESLELNPRGVEQKTDELQELHQTMHNIVSTGFTYVNLLGKGWPDDTSTVSIQHMFEFVKNSFFIAGSPYQ